VKHGNPIQEEETMEDVTRDIRRNREDQYFLKLEQMRMDEMRRQSERQAQTIRLMEAFGIRDQDLVRELSDAGFDIELKQVFLNIIMNALQAMESGGRLHISAEMKRPLGGFGTPRNSFCIFFRDTGSGIPKSDLDHVFDPFFTTKRDGTGLGLSISYGIVRQHGGEIEIASAAASADSSEHGTTVTLTLPCA
jgi:signal transduction histidine kinase